MSITLKTPKAENALKKILILLHSQTGHDFSQYKSNTIDRRTKRRMVVNQIATIEKYLAYLQETPAEVEALFHELLIGATRFFRDPEAFKALEEQVIPKLFEGKPADAVIRVWVPGCSTGEEAYSIAILLAERQEAIKQSFKVQIFGSDIDSRAIATARAGIYPVSIASDISPERLKRFFVDNSNGSTCRIHQGIRDMLFFSEHNLIKDPPFSKLDLISCRNLLNYLDGNLQKRVIPLFHYALIPKGFLFQGISETVVEFHYLFAALDRKLKLYQRKDDFNSVPSPVPSRLAPPMPAASIFSPPQINEKITSPVQLSLRELTEQALLQRAPAAVLVNNQGDTLYVHGRIGMYLELPQGEVGIGNIVQMAREGLRYELFAALNKAAVGKEIIYSPGLRVKTNGGFTSVNLTVQPIATNPASAQDAFFYLVHLETALLPGVEMREHEGSPWSDSGTNELVAHLGRELSAKEEKLQTIREQLETFTEELKSANEELQSVNEELHSTNEELVTVNAELHERVAELNVANSDMENLVASSEIATVFLDRKLNVKRYSPAMVGLFNLIPADIGRPFQQLSGKIAWPNLTEDAEALLAGRPFIDREVRDIDADLYYLHRVLPYRTKEGEIDGLVAIFFNITDRKRVENALQMSEQRFRSMVEGISDYAIFMLDREGLVTSWNSGAERIKGYHQEEILGRNFSCFYPSEAMAAGLPEQELLIAERDGRCAGEGWRVRKDGSRFWAGTIIVATRDDTGPIVNFTIITRDLTEQKRAEEEAKVQAEIMRARNEELERLNRIMEGRELRMIELKKEVNELCRKAGRPERYPLAFLKT